ncbi:MAG: N-acetylmuramoyl-L-alanine amidase [Sharpea porci]|uniref:N-acetylmuramoyl-L-alanine amidase n=1 Tax=Sharpea porci TaxID=2652286 RepID=UPI002409F402|nr:N-acetylmuramoyl-L-alanine amidase [Sharpea porci]MDD6711642.1 N-acetylmuramoyl-L-alanine amidase [Sharpea porci]
MESKSNRKKHLIKMSSFMLSGMLVLTLQATDVKAANPVVLVIDPGHGGNDSGAGGTYNGHSYYEKNMTLSIAKELKSQLEATGRFKIYMTRETDTYKSLTYRTDYARQMNADALVSVHINSAGSSAKGAEVEIPNTSLYSQLHTEGENIANSILNELSSLGIHRRGAFTRNSANGTKYSDGSTADYYAIVRGAKSNAMTGIIVEHAFISNPNELGQFLSSEDKLKALGRADARGINNYYATHTPVREVRESDYALVYDYNYYINKHSDLKKAYGTNRNAAFNHFLTYGMKEGRQAISSFDVTSYRNANADLRTAFEDNYEAYYNHYIQYGYKEGRKTTGVTSLQNTLTKYNNVDYSLVYDFNYYINKYADLKKAYGSNNDVAVLKHFIEYGMKEGRQANANFNVSYYKANYEDLRSTYGNDTKAYYLHYINYGYKEGRVANKLLPTNNTRPTSPVQNVTTYKGINYSAVYNQDYYYKNNPSVQKQFKATDGNGLIKNFVEKGMSQGLRASANFDVNSYRLQYSDLRNAYGNDLKSYYLHYIKYGTKERRKTTGTTQMVGYVTTLNGVDYSNVYDFNFYINKYSDLKNAFGTYNDKAALEHFVNYGMRESRQASSTFILSYYRANYEDLRKAYGNNNAAYYEHYIKYGKNEGRVANRLLPPSSNNTTISRPTSPSNSQTNQSATAQLYEISGSPKATEAQMVKYFASHASFPDYYASHDKEVKTLNDFVHIYYQEATDEGIRPEVAFAQMINETGFLTYTGRVKIEQYNFAGLGAIDRDQSSNSFSSVREGIRAQIQHLKAYAVKGATLRNPLIDGRFKYVTQGSAQYVEWLGSNENPNHLGWATTPGYGNALRKIIDNILAIK